MVAATNRPQAVRRRTNRLGLLISTAKRARTRASRRLVLQPNLVTAPTRRVRFAGICPVCQSDVLAHRRVFAHPGVVGHLSRIGPDHGLPVCEVS